MAIGITSYGAYVPIYRLSLAEIGRAWEGGGGPGEKAIANYDEDSLTTAVEAAIDCLTGIDRKSIDRFYLASTTLPYQEKLNASIAAAAVDLKDEALTSDFTGSVRSGTIALQMGLDAIKAKSAKRVLVAASDCRLTPHNSPAEMAAGDGAAAVLLGDTNVIATVEAQYNISSEFLGEWRRSSDSFTQTWEDRFVIEEGYLKILPQVVAGIMKQNNLTVKDFNKVVFYGPDARRHKEMAAKLGFDVKTQVQDPLFGRIGNTGAALVPMLLVAALENAKAGDKLLVAGYGDGADAFVLQVTDEIAKVRDRRGIKGHLASKMMLSNYEKYLHFRKYMQFEADRRPGPSPFLPMQWREHKEILRCYGSKCRHCGTIQFPVQRVCVDCQTVDQHDLVRLSDKKGKIWTYSLDQRSTVAELPLVLNIINMDGGGRYYSVMTDRDVSKVDINMPVELTFRKFHEEGGFHNYFWKCRPIRVEKGV